MAEIKLVLVFSFIILCHCAKDAREIIPGKYENCNAENLPIKVFISLDHTIDRLNFSGYIEIRENIKDLEALFDADRCDLDMKHCYKYLSLKIPDVCDLISNSNSKKPLFFDLLRKAFKPAIKCPVAAGNYSFNANVDIKPFSKVGIDNSIWLLKYIGNSMDKTKKPLLCWSTETKIIKVRPKSK